jgi:hypothetical protein
MLDATIIHNWRPKVFVPMHDNSARLLALIGQTHNQMEYFDIFIFFFCNPLPGMM